MKSKKPARPSRAKNSAQPPDGARDVEAAAPLSLPELTGGGGDTVALSDPALQERVIDEADQDPGEPPQYVTEGPDDAPEAGEQPFKILGYNNGIYYYFPRRKKQVVALTASQHKLENLLQLAPLEYWKETYSKNLRKLAIEAADDLISKAQSRGVFIYEASLRGAGCWLDEKRVVLHCGNILYVNNEARALDDFDSEYVYTAAARLIDRPGEALTDFEAARFRKLCEAPTWENSLSGTLLAGWLVIAPIGAALEFRPSIALTGESDSGKSTIINKIIKPSLGRFGLFADGGTTEPSLRTMMGYDARPLVYDEGGKGQNMPPVIELIRKAATGASVNKYGQKPFTARFAACVSAVNPPIDRVEDENRFAFLRLIKNTRETALQEYDDILQLIKEVICPDFSSKLLGRTILNFGTLQQNIDVFTRAARMNFKAARASLVIGTMLAGAYSLGRSKVITFEAADAWIKKHDWEDYKTHTSENEPQRLIRHICSSTLRYSSSAGDISIGELIGAVIDNNDATADKLLRQYVIKVSDSGVCFGDSSPNLAKLLRETDWAVKWNRLLCALPGAVKVRGDYFSRGVKVNGVKLPLEFFTKEKAPYRQDKFL